MDDRDDRDEALEDSDLGAPIAELKELRREPSRGFLDSIRARVARRLTAGQLLDLGLPVIGRTILEYLSMIFALAGGDPHRSHSKESDDE